MVKFSIFLRNKNHYAALFSSLPEVKQHVQCIENYSIIMQDASKAEITKRKKNKIIHQLDKGKNYNG